MNKWMGLNFLLSGELGETGKKGSDGRFRPLNQAHYRYSIQIIYPGDIFIFCIRQYLQTLIFSHLSKFLNRLELKNESKKQRSTFYSVVFSHRKQFSIKVVVEGLFVSFNHGLIWELQLKESVEFSATLIFYLYIYSESV